MGYDREKSGLSKVPLRRTHSSTPKPGLNSMIAHANKEVVSAGYVGAIHNVSNLSAISAVYVANSGLQPSIVCGFYYPLLDTYNGLDGTINSITEGNRDVYEAALLGLSGRLATLGESFNAISPNSFSRLIQTSLAKYRMAFSDEGTRRNLISGMNNVEGSGLRTKALDILAEGHEAIGTEDPEKLDKTKVDAFAQKYLGHTFSIYGKSIKLTK